MKINPKHIISLTEARKRFFDIANEVQKPDTHYVLTEKGSPKVVIMSVEEFEGWQETIDVVLHNPDILTDIAQAEADLEAGRTVPFEKVLTELGFAVADNGKVTYVSNKNRKKSAKRS